jgi:oligopeptide/dipeptide ABC transporter ATP-binding protein
MLHVSHSVTGLLKFGRFLTTLAMQFDVPKGGVKVHLLELEHVSITAEHSPGEGARLLHDVSLGIQQGEIGAIVGESGSGKTTLLRAISVLSSRGNGISIEGRILFDGEEITAADPHRLQRLRRQSIRYIFQEPAMVFNPLSRMGSQIQMLTGRDRYDEELLLSDLRELGLEEPGEVLRSYPHQLSPGMAQRITIAVALLNSPALVLADEPTSATDIIHRTLILRLLREQCRTRKMGVLLATHDLRIAERFADSIIVLYAGRIVEQSPARTFFETPLHPYSQLLLDRMPAAPDGILPGVEEKRQMRGNGSPCGCSFQSSCPIVQDRCRREEPELISPTPDRKVRCLFSK